MASQILGFVSSESPTTDQVPMVRLSKVSNQELNYELQIKANELEKIFAAHKLRFPPGGRGGGGGGRGGGGDHQLVSNFSLKTRIKQPAAADHLQFDQNPIMINPKSTEVVVIGPAVQLPETNRKESFGCFSDAAEIFDDDDDDDDHHSTRRRRRMSDNREDYDITLNLINEEVGFLEESRGKFYERYKQKRDAKLKEEWSLKRDQKEAEMKAMQESLEHSRAEMKAKFPAKRDSALHARQRAERLRSFNIRSSSKNTLQQVSVQNEEDDLSEFPEHPPYQQERSSFTDVSTIKSFKTKKVLPNRSLSSAVHRTSATPNTRSSVKASNSASGRRRTKLSVSNPKTSSGISKTSSHQLFGNYSGGNSTNEDLFLVKEDRTRISQSLRNSSATSSELKDLPPRKSDFVVYTPLRFVKEQAEQGLYSKLPKNIDPKPFLKKGSGIGPGAGAGLSKLKASMAPDNLRNEEEFGQSADWREDPMNIAIEEEERDLETVVVDVEASKALDLLTVFDNEQSRMSHESEKSSDLEPENGDALRSFSQLQPDLVADVPVVSSTFHYAVELVHDSAGESPASSNSYMHHPLSFANESSEIGGSEYSSMASPALWNSHSVTKMETDAALKRKKWGDAQKLIILANNASHNQPRKEVTKGFKRFLKFGRKSRKGTESPVDWISATTSEGDDEIEDGRMGFSEGHPSYDSFKNGELFKEQVEALCSSIPTPPENFKLREDHLLLSTLKAPPGKSFFSLSSFRSSKGSDQSKPR